ncbi:MAG TPA: ATP-binding protein, partial [Thermodesulfobacteriota bacterium]|nr:ATP-binding protein [Thermodesulfobacteriota bacterium]
ERLCRLHNIKYDKDVIPFAIRHLGGNPFYIKGLVRAGQKMDIGLASLRNFMDIYTYEIMKGGTGLYLSSLLSPLLDGKDRKSQLRVLHNYLSAGEGNLKTEPGFRNNELSSSLERMRYTGDRVLADFVDAVYGMEVKGKSASQVMTEIAGKRLKEGYRLHVGQTRIEIKEELRNVLERFNGQRVPKVVFQNRDFASRYTEKGAEAGITLAEDDDTLILPQLLGSFDDREGTEKTGLYIIEAQGFYDGRYEDGYESVWVAGVKDSIEAVTIGDVERFIDRCSRLKEKTRTVTMVRWVVSKGGFTGEAQKALKAEGIFSSDFTQLRLLQRLIEEKGIDSTIAGLMPLREFELVIPMAQEAELVAARALEEVAKKAGFDEDAVSQLKMALIEACINAFEHSRVKNGKVSVSFFVEKERIVVYVQNEGRGFDVTSVPRPDIDEKLTSPNKRGWGIELMKGLMDEIRFENVNEGTKLVMVKYLKSKEEKNPLVKGLKVKQGRL